MAITDEILALKAKEDEARNGPSWIKDLIDKRYQPKTERLKRAPVGFNFERDPFDPSSYYKDLGSFRSISRAATEVALQEVANRRQAEQERADAEARAALQGINAKFTYGTGASLGKAVGGASKKYGLKSVSSNTAKAADYWGSRYGIKTVGGYRSKGSVPGSDHPKGRALDFMINNIKNGKSTGDALANDVIRNYKAWNVKYVIWNRYIWQPGRGWKKYNGPSPHTDHVHVSFNE